MVVVMGVVNGNGWEAWSRLYSRFDPRTPPKALMAVMSVMQTKKIKDGRDLPNAVQDWDVTVKNFEVEHNINRASLGKPTPMEVDRVQEEYWHEDHGWHEEQEWEEGWPEKEEAAVEIGYIGEACKRCGGHGQSARDATTKGKGKAKEEREQER